MAPRGLFFAPTVKYLYFFLDELSSLEYYPLNATRWAVRQPAPRQRGHNGAHRHRRIGSRGKAALAVAGNTPAGAISARGEETGESWPGRPAVGPMELRGFESRPGLQVDRLCSTLKQMGREIRPGGWETSPGCIEAILKRQPGRTPSIMA
jgi:hypothetical protein